MARSANIKVLQDRLDEKGYRCTDMLNKSNGTTHQIIEKYQNGSKTITVDLPAGENSGTVTVDATGK